MLGDKKILLFIFFSVAVGIFSTSFAQQQQPPSLDALKNQIPGPVSNFINSIQNIGTDFSVRNTWLNVNDWFLSSTGGTSLTDVLKFVGNLLVWLFSLLVNLIKWGLSFL